MQNTIPIHLVFMLEEESAKHLLETLLPKILSDLHPSKVSFKCIPHQGKSDLQGSIPRKLKVWGVPRTFFVILHDQDSHNCLQLKQNLQRICAKQDRHSPLIRIACRELEAWYFGDLDAVQKAFPHFNADKCRNKPKYKNPDKIADPSTQLKRLVRGFQKSSAAREIPQHMEINKNSSNSFQHLVQGIQYLLRQNLHTRQK